MAGSKPVCSEVGGSCRRVAMPFHMKSRLLVKPHVPGHLSMVAPGAAQATACPARNGALRLAPARQPASGPSLLAGRLAPWGHLARPAIPRTLSASMTAAAGCDEWEACATCGGSACVQQGGLVTPHPLGGGAAIGCLAAFRELVWAMLLGNSQSLLRVRLVVRWVSSCFRV